MRTWRRHLDALYRRTIHKTRDPLSMKLGVFRLGLLEDRDIRVAIFPEVEELLISSPCLDLISRQSERPAKFQARQCADGLTTRGPGMIENFLKLRRGQNAFPGCQIRLTSYVNRVKHEIQALNI